MIAGLPDKEYYQRQYLKNRDKRLAQAKAYAEQNKDKIAEYQKEYAQNNKEAIDRNRKKYADNNREKINLSAKIYRSLNKDKRRKWQQDWRKMMGEEMRRYNEKARIRGKKYKEELTDYYIKSILKKLGFPSRDIPKEIIEIKRLIIKTKRYVKAKASTKPDGVAV